MTTNLWRKQILNKNRLIIFAFSLYVLTILKNSPTFSSFQTTRKSQVQLIDLKDFRFLINPYIGGGCYDQVPIIFIVFSSLENRKERNAIRDSWGDNSNEDCIKTVFLVGTSDNNTIVSSIETESTQHSDIAQGNFIDSMRNLTYKHIMGLKWVADYYKYAKYAVKIDDDIILDPVMMREKLKIATRDKAVSVFCGSLASAKRKNLIRSLKRREYTDYCEGPVVIYSAEVIPRLLEESTKSPLSWFDDVYYVTGVLARKSGVPLVKFESNWFHFSEDVKLLVDNDIEELSRSENKSKNLMYMYRYMYEKARIKVKPYLSKSIR